MSDREELISRYYKVCELIGIEEPDSYYFEMLTNDEIENEIKELVNEYQSESLDIRNVLFDLIKQNKNM